MNWRYSRQISVIALLVFWGAVMIGLGLVRFGPYGIEEGAARALLLNWTVADRIVNPIVIFGIPDLRALLFVPLSIYWPGSLVAPKVFTLLIAFASALLLYRWCRRRHGAEAALLATGLLLISPLVVSQVNAIGSGIYLLLLIGLGAWFDERWRKQQRMMGIWYFLQLFTCAIIVSLHPAGLAYVISLVWRWYRDPASVRMQRHLYIGLGIATVFVLLLQAGWDQLPWWNSPTVQFNQLLLPQPPFAIATGWIPGLVALIAAACLALAQRRELLSDLIGCTLISGSLLGALAANGDWALLPMTLLLYEGTAQLIRWQQSWQRHNFAGQRGLVLAAVFLFATLFMHSDKDLRQYRELGYMTPQDELIMQLTGETTAEGKPIKVASQWPGRTMLALKHPVFPLPKAAASGQELLNSIEGIDYLIFDPLDPKNRGLAHNIAQLSGYTQTVALQEGGVIVKVLGKSQSAETAQSAQRPDSEPDKSQR